MSDLISRKETIRAIDSLGEVYISYYNLLMLINRLPSAEPERTTGNHVHLCGTCKKSIPECGMNHVIFGDGFGNDNVCACSGYEVAEPERKTGKWINGRCDQCGEHAPFWAMASTYYLSNFCQNCGADMRGER